MKSLYHHYFDSEISVVKGQVKRTEQELLERAFAGCLQFCKEFEFLPYMVSQRVCAIVWYSVANAGEGENTVLNESGVN